MPRAEHIVPRPHKGLFYRCSGYYYSDCEAVQTRRVRDGHADARSRAARSPAVGLPRLPASLVSVGGTQGAGAREPSGHRRRDRPVEERGAGRDTHADPAAAASSGARRGHRRAGIHGAAALEKIAVWSASQNQRRPLEERVSDYLATTGTRRIGGSNLHKTGFFLRVHRVLRGGELNSPW